MGSLLPNYLTEVKIEAPDACLSHVFQAFLNMVHIILAHPRIVHGPAAILNILHERFAVAGPGSAQAVYGIHHRIKTGTGTQPGGRGQKDTHAIPGAAGRLAYAGIIFPVFIKGRWSGMVSA